MNTRGSCSDKFQKEDLELVEFVYLYTNLFAYHVTQFNICIENYDQADANKYHYQIPQKYGNFKKVFLEDKEKFKRIIEETWLQNKKTFEALMVKKLFDFMTSTNISSKIKNNSDYIDSSMKMDTLIKGEIDYFIREIEKLKKSFLFDESINQFDAQYNIKEILKEIRKKEERIFDESNKRQMAQ